MPKGIPKNGINKGWFKKGKSFWLGKNRNMPWLPKFVKGHIPWNKDKHGVQAMENHPGWKGGRIGQSQGYIRHRNYGNYQLEHRFLIEQSIGRRLKKNEVVHHKNGDRKDNSIENLQVFKNQSEHIKHHWSINTYRKINI